MSRLQRIMQGVATGYLLLALNILYTMGTVPLALAYLPDKEEFGLWSLVSQTALFFGLIDLGMTMSLSRLLVDHKDHPDTGDYGSLIQTSGAVMLLQGAVLWSCGWLLAPWLSGMLAIAPGWQESFVSLLRWQCLAAAFSMATRVFSQVLYAHQRNDILNYVQMVVLVVMGGGMWLGFALSQGVHSLVWASIAGVLTQALMQGLAVGWLGLWPKRGQWGGFSRDRFRELWHYGKDLFLLAIGNQFIMASQVILITRCLGLEMAAAWTVGTKAFVLGCQIIWRLYDISAPAFSEMMVRHEEDRLRQRYRDLVVVTASLAVVGAVLNGLCNADFVMVWTHGKIHWSRTCDVFVGVWMVLLAVGHCNSSLVVLTKKLGFLRFMGMIEGGVFFLSAMLLARVGGLPGVLGASIVCGLVFTGAYGVWRVAQRLQFSVAEMLTQWLLPAGKVLAVFLPLAVLGGWLMRDLPPLHRLLVSGPLFGMAGAVILVRWGSPLELKREIYGKLPQPLRPLFRVLGNLGAE